jgi:protoporphyrinogen oxidase
MELGHAARIARVTELLRDLPRVELAAAGVFGVGIPDTIKQATEAASRL